MFKQTASGYSEGSVFASLFLGVRLAENVSNGRKSLIHPGSGKNSSGKTSKSLLMGMLQVMILSKHTSSVLLRWLCT